MQEERMRIASEKYGKKLVRVELFPIMLILSPDSCYNAAS
jgi:hypothetical protein